MIQTITPISHKIRLLKRLWKVRPYHYTCVVETINISQTVRKQLLNEVDSTLIFNSDCIIVRQ